MKTGIYLALFIMGSMLYACEKDDDYPPGGTPPPLQTPAFNLITSHYWTIGEFYMRIISDINADSVLDTTYYFDLPDPCMFDNKYYFKSNGYMITDDGTNICQFTSGDSIAWAVANNDTEIVLDTDHFHIENLTSSQFKISITNAGTPPTMLIDETITFVYP